MSDLARPHGALHDGDLADPELDAKLAGVWGTAPGWLGALCSVDHKVVGRRYIVTAFIFLFLGGLLAVAMRLQLARAEAGLIGPDLYNQIFTMHGSTMMFLFAVPVMEAFAVYLVPLMVGTRNIAFPRLNAFSYWVYLFGGLMIWIAFALNTGADVGWFAYVPLSAPQSGGRRGRAAVAAPVLVLWSSGSVHHLHSGDRHGIGDRRRFCAAARLRLLAAGPVLDGDGFSVVRTVGPPHVHDGAPAPWGKL